MNISISSKSTLLLSLIFACLLMLGTGCSSAATESAKSSVPSITPTEVLAEISDGEDVRFLDVRSIDEYNAGHIDGAILMPYDTMTESAVSEELPDKNQMIVLYCRSGRRAGIAGNTLLDLGYTNVYNMGGVSSWPNALVTD